VAAVGALVFGLALHAGSIAVVLAAVVFGLGALGWNALVYVSAGERVDPSLAARSVAVAATVVFVLSGVATPLLGALVDAVGWDALWLATAVIAAVGAYLAHRLPPQAVAGAS
jgi:cyanate permease